VSFTSLFTWDSNIFLCSCTHRQQLGCIKISRFCGRLEQSSLVSDETEPIDLRERCHRISLYKRYRTRQEQEVQKSTLGIGLCAGSLRPRKRKHLRHCGSSKGNAVIKRILIDHKHPEVRPPWYRRGDAFFFIQ
jgi:hypothetical protein